MDEESVLEGRPIPILVPRRRIKETLDNDEVSEDDPESHMFTLDEKELEKVLLQDHIKNCIAVVVSVAGAFRKGKSFLLDFFLRYLNFMYTSPKKLDAESWLGDENTPLKGFSWQGGSEADTTGILMWSKVFCTNLPNNEKVAIILLDTQGTSDSKSSDHDDTVVFALSTMLSSVLVYNLSQNIEKNDLQHLDYFTGYGSLALERTGIKPFQTLQFLVRDWSSPNEANYGEQGGARKLENEMKKISDKPMWDRMNHCFTEINCFLMPHPGLKVAITKPGSKFDGRLSDIDIDFKTCLQTFVPSLLSPDHLVPKTVNGERITVKELVKYWKTYMQIFKTGGLPKPKSIFEATVEANNLSAVAAARETYNRLMDEVCGGQKPFLSTSQLEVEHKRCFQKALEQFHSTRKMGGKTFSEFYQNQLEKNIEIDFNRLKKYNKSKTIFFKLFQWLGSFVERIVQVFPVWTVLVACFGSLRAFTENIPWRALVKICFEGGFLEIAKNIFAVISCRAILGFGSAESMQGVVEICIIFISPIILWKLYK